MSNQDHKTQNSNEPKLTNEDNSMTTSGLSSISEYLKQEATTRKGRSIPPLEKWNPERCAEMDLIIKANGEWWHEGSKISRQSLVDLFSSVLWREGSAEDPKYYLKTPVEKLGIQVEDVPFLMTDVNIIDNDGSQTIEFVSSTGDVVELNEEHPLEMNQYKGEDRPYIEVRFGMKGLITRNVLMHLIKLGELTQENGETSLTLKSGGKTFSVSVPNE